MSTALQNIERARGAKAERAEIIRIIKTYLTLYKKDLILQTLLAEIQERNR